MKTSTSDPSHLAALIDGEPEPGGLEACIRAAGRDPALLARVERGLMIGQVLRGERVDLNVRGMHERVAEALAAEPIPLRPKRSAQPVRVFNRPAAALALAASIATVAVLVGPRWLSEQRVGPDASATQSALAERGTQTATDGSSSTESVVAATNPAIVARWEVEAPADTTALDALLVDHRERASASSLTGFIPYAAVVGQHAGR